MAQYLISDTYLTNIAEAIRGKLGVSTQYTPGQMSGAIQNIVVGTTLNNQNKTITPTETAQAITADSGYTGLGTVTIRAIPSSYVGSEITRRTSTNLSVNGATVTVPAGYYETQATKTVSSGAAGTPTASKGTVSNNTITITPSVTNTTGYITGSTKTGTGVTVSASELVSGSKSITSNGTDIDVTNYATVNVNVPTGSTINNQNKTVTPTETQQSISADSGYTGLGTVTINAISSTYVGSGVTKKAAATITPTTTNQSIAANTYLTGKQTISGDANLVAGNIKSGVSIFGVSGSYTGSGGGITPSGNLEIIANGTNIDVTNYATVSVAVPSQGIVITDTTDTNGGTIRTLTATEFYGQAYTLDDFAMKNFSGSITLPTATKIGACTFAGSNITEIHAPDVTQFYSNNNSTGLGVFQNCKSLTTVDMPNYSGTGSGGYQFSGCTGLIHIFLPNGATGQYMFNGCSNLQTAVLGGTGAMNQNDYYNCSKLEIVDTRNSRVHTNSFSGCSKLATLIIRRTSLCTLSNINAFTNTPFASGKAGGILYVPADLISEYEAATNWSTILGYTNNQIKSIESTHTDPDAFLDLTLYYGDGTPLGT